MLLPTGLALLCVGIAAASPLLNLRDVPASPAPKCILVGIDTTSAPVSQQVIIQYFTNSLGLLVDCNSDQIFGDFTQPATLTPVGSTPIPIEHPLAPEENTCESFALLVAAVLPLDSSVDPKFDLCATVPPCTRYTVKEGDTCESIAAAASPPIAVDDLHRWNTFLSCIAVDPGLCLKTSIVASEPEPEPEPECVYAYTTVAGDTCETVVDNLFITQEKLEEHNSNLVCSTVFTVGTELCLSESPCSTTPYTTIEGSTCAGIAAIHGMTPAQVVAANPTLDCANVPLGFEVCITSPFNADSPPCHRTIQSREGDTCKLIGERYEMPADLVLAVNADLDCAHIPPGTDICVTTAQEGDIGKEYDCTEDGRRRGHSQGRGNRGCDRGGRGHHHNGEHHGHDDEDKDEDEDHPDGHDEPDEPEQPPTCSTIIKSRRGDDCGSLERLFGLEFGVIKELNTFLDCDDM